MCGRQQGFGVVAVAVVVVWVGGEGPGKEAGCTEHAWILWFWGLAVSLEDIAPAGSDCNQTDMHGSIVPVKDALQLCALCLLLRSRVHVGPAP